MLLLGLAGSLLWSVLFLVRPQLFQILSRPLYDHLSRSCPGRKSAVRLVIVDIDDESLKRYGQWPWPRFRMAGLLDRIREMQPAVVALDMFFPEPDRTSLGLILREMSQNHHLEVPQDFLNGKLQDNDHILAQALEKGPFVLGNQFTFDDSGEEKGSEALHPVQISVLQKGESGGKCTIPESSGVLGNLKILADRVDASGFLNFRPDEDGMLRRLPMLIAYRERVYPSLALAVMMKLRNVRELVLEKDGEALQAIRFEGQRMPVDRYGQVLVRFRGPGHSFRYLSATDVLAGRVEKAELEGSIVLLGTSALGIKELLATPFGSTFPGVEVHATVIDNLLSGDFLSVPSWWAALNLLLIFGLGLMIGLAFAFGGFWAGSTILLLGGSGLWLGSWGLFVRKGWFADPVYPFLSLVTLYFVLTLIWYQSRHRQSRERARLSEARFRTLFDMAPMPLCYLSREGKTLAVNRCLLETMGYDITDIPSQEEAWKRIVPKPELYESLISKWRWDVARALEGELSVANIELPLQFKDGRLHSMVVVTRVIGEGTIIGFFDISEREELQREREELQRKLHHSQKLEAIGGLAGGVAHDFNNMLGAIIGYAELAMSEMEPDDPLSRNLQNIHEAARRSSVLTRQLLTFARQQAVTPERFDLNKAIEPMLQMVRQLIGENIELTWSPGKDPGFVFMDPSQLDQIVVNLCVNSRDAIVGTGRVRIETALVSFDESHCRFNPDYQPGRYVCLSVEDDGSGMSRETMEHIFEPFFTTKALGKGTGLGMATVYGITRQNGGFVTVQSELGRGTEIKVFLPESEEPAEQALGVSREVVSPGNGETLLVVEDDPLILEMAAAMLKKLGYSVFSTASPQEALQIVQESRSAIRLVITDLIMPEMSGFSLVNRLRKIRPEIRFLFMSGYPAHEVIRQNLVLHESEYIQKPFSLARLSTSVSQRLED